MRAAWEERHRERRVRRQRGKMVRSRIEDVDRKDVRRVAST